ncbi:MAG TPA: hypothetical protein VL285_15515 [Bryobacteraceae bacterium]|jgi:hypothetical protein|nr:hypothetical protein [Bryobacteraceae bacterium]
MSVWQCAPSNAPLGGREGELVAVSIAVSPLDLEAALECLANVGFPINPQICHSGFSVGEGKAIIEFPAYSGGLTLVRAALANAGLDSAAVRVRGMLDQIQSLLDHQPRHSGDDAG